LYPNKSINRIHFIKQAQELGFSLKEIKELLNLRVKPEATTSDVRSRATEKIGDIGNKIKRLQEMKKSLEVLVESCCDEASASECSILENLSSEDKF
jgi:MerR family mercuric resistance operon transcriptional regulator